MHTSAYRSRLWLWSLEDRTAPTAGDLDLSFGVGGFAVIRSDSGNADLDSADAVLVQPDGRIVLAGRAAVGPVPFPGAGNYDFAATRLNPDGSPDPTFGAGGRATVGFDDFDVSGSMADFAQAAALQPDGKIVLAGFASTAAGGLDAAVARLNPDGSPDLSFGTAGRVTVPFDRGAANADSFNAVAVQPDGKIVLAGGSDGPDGSRMAAARLNPDGSPDLSFGTTGKTTVPFDYGGGQSFAGSGGLALLPDGGILLTGGAWSVAQNYDFAAARLLPDGSLDPTFGAGGTVTVGFDLQPTGTDSGGEVAVQPDGKIILAGTVDDVGYLFKVGVVRLLPDGSLDTSFGSAGRFTGSYGGMDEGHSICHAVSIRPDGKILLAGNAPGSTPSTVGAARLNPDGSLDPAFGVGGTVTIPYPDGLNANTADMAVQPDGRVVLAGAVIDGSGDQDFVAVRLLGDPLVPPPPPPPPPPAVRVLAGGPANGSAVRLVITSGQLAVGESVVFFPGFAGAVRTALADVNGDDTPDLVGGAGPGGGPRVAVIDGATGARVADFFAFEPSFLGGVFVAAADLDGDGKAEVVVTPDRGGGPIAAVFDGSGVERTRLLGIPDPGFRGGARVATGDVTGDRTPDLVVSAGFLGGPRVTVWDGRTVLDGERVRVADFFAFEDTLRNGAFVTAGDIDGDGRAELALGAGPGGAPRVRVADGARLGAWFGSLDQAAWAERFGSFFAGDPGLRGGVRVLLRDADGDGLADLVTGSGAGEPSRVCLYKAAGLLTTAGPAPDQDLDPFGGAVLAGGVFVG